jgi:hypothetical protein
VKRFGAASNDTALAPGSAASLQCDVDFFVRFIQANEGGEALVVLIHGSCSLSGLVFELICVSWAKHALLPFCESLIVEALKYASANENSFVERERTGTRPKLWLKWLIDRLRCIFVAGRCVFPGCREIKDADLSTLKVLVTAELFTICRS